MQQVMITDYKTLSPNEPLSRAMELILAGFQQDFPVVEGDQVVGVLTRADLFRALTDQGREIPVDQVMQRKFETASPTEMLETVFSRLQDRDFLSMPVTRDGRLVGIMSQDNVGEFLMIQAALSGKR